MADSMFNIYKTLAEENAAPRQAAIDYSKIPEGRVAQAVLGQATGLLAGKAMEAAGFQTPQQMQAQAMKEVQALHPDPKTYQDFVALANEFKNRGMMDHWKQVMGVADDMKTDTTTRGKDIQKHAEILGCDWDDPTVDDEGLTCKQRALAHYRETVRAGVGERFEGKYAEETAEDIVDKNTALVANADLAVQNILKTDEVLDLLDKDELHTGIFAEFQTNISRILSAAGSDISSGYASRTQLLEALLGSDVFPMIKQLGIGARGLDTVPEREFLLKVMVGEKKMEADTIRQMTEIRQRISERIIEKYNDRIKKGGFNLYKKFTGEAVEPIDLKSIREEHRAKARGFKHPKGAVSGTDKRTGKRIWRYPDGTFHDDKGALVTNGE